MRAAARLANLALFVALVGCGTTSRPSADARDLARSAVARVHAVPSFAHATAPAIVRRGDGWGAPDVELPATADGAIRFSDGAFALRPLGTDARKGVMVDGALAYTDVAPETDIVVQAVASGIEELRVMRGPNAPRELRWSIEARGLVRVVSGRVEILDARGAVRVRSEPAFAVDAAGVRRELSLHLEGEKTLVAGLDTTGLRYPIVVDPTWIYVVSTIPLGSFYAYSWVQPSPSLVLQLGGSNNSTDGTATFDVPTETWTPHFITGSYHTYCEAIWVPSIGKALIAGGRTGGGNYQNDAMLYSTTPAPSGVALSATMTTGRAFHTLTLVTVSGAERVLVVGGADGTISAEMFDPSTSTFVARTPMANARTKHAATLLASGKVLVTGGRPSTSGALSSAEIYDPAANSWAAAGNTMANPRYDHRQARLADGRVLVIGGADATGAPLDTTSIYDPTTNTFGAGPKMGSARAAFSITELPSGKLLVAGGTGTSGNLSTTEIYDPVANTFSAGPTMNAARSGHRAALLSGGRVLVGSSSTAATTEILWPDATTCTSTSASCPYCVDGVCCDSACSGQCDACDLPGKKGICSPVSGEAPHGTRAACSPFAVCVYDAVKASSACATSCASDAACAAGSYCVSPGPSGTCAPKQVDGAGCSTSSQCLSGTCVDGVCCKTACTAQCESCAEPGSLGTCIKVDGMPRGTRPACTAPYACSAGACATSCTKDVECATGRTCDVGSGTCVPKKGNGSACTGGAQCVSGLCVDGTCCNSDCTNPCFACDLPGKAGTCSAIDVGGKPHGTRSCAPYAVCGAAGACPTSCASGADCLSSACDSATSTCTPVSDAGPEVGPDAATDSGADIGVADGAAPDPGPRPSVGEFVKCSKSTDCASGFCVEGVCCDSACTDRCHSCALLTSPGKCTAEPVGVDLKNECGPSLACVGTCDGSGQCIGAGTGTMCSRNRCTGASAGVGPAYCPAPGGKCVTDDVVPFDCAPYVCEPAFGACVTACKSSADCANGFVCDTAAKTCVAPPAPEDSGGCAVSSPAKDPGSLGILALIGLALARGVRRRRA